MRADMIVAITQSDKIVLNDIKEQANTTRGLSWGSDGKESLCNAGDPGSIPGLGRSPGEGNGYPL